MSEFKHVSVLPSECMEGLNIRPDGIYADGTAGGGGHSRLIGERLSPEGTLICVDRDEEAIRVCRERLADLTCKVIFLNTDFASLPSYLIENGILLDGILLDLGVSSYQLDTPERGFSYMADAPLDMRMSQSSELTARTIVNQYPQDKLEKIFFEYGEERYSRAIAAAIVRRRAVKLIETTFELSDIIKSAMPPKALREKQHPSRRVFQALRLETNNELGEISRLLDAILPCMASGGRIAVITFHSLEDRIVKKAFADFENPCVCPPDFPVCVCGRVSAGQALKPILPTAEEIERNQRSHSARLRVFCKK